MRQTKGQTKREREGERGGGRIGIIIGTWNTNPYTMPTPHN